MATHTTSIVAQRHLPLTIISAGTLAAFGLLTLSLMLFLLKQVIPALCVVGVVSLLIAAATTSRPRWIPLLGSVWFALVLAMNLGGLIFEISNPQNAPFFPFTMLGAALALIGLVTSLVATAQRYGLLRAAVPAWFLALCGLIAGVAGGTILMVGIVQAQGVSGVSPAVLASLPMLESRPGLTFGQTELRAKAGDAIALRLANADTSIHSFDIDDLNVHVSMPVGRDVLALFRPTKPGSYTFYCAVPGHGQTMRGTLVVMP